MAQKKLERFAAIKTFDNVLEYPANMKGKWKDFFKNNNPVVLELACGRGEYTVGLAGLFPHKNYIGVDIKGNRMFIGAKKCLTENLTNAAFLRTQIEKIPDYFSANEVSDIWITFPDPQLRLSKAKKRLTHPRFLRLYAQILAPSGSIHLKTDSPVLFNFTKKVISLYNLQLIEENENVFSGSNISEELKIKTHYEKLDIAQSNAIFYLRFTLPYNLINIDTQLQQIINNEEKAG
ncbi:MAG: tRNA (guanosine(46)-N7)-methyltransferase TrmB [Chitinophagaceae bacterium]|nr:tRNA (guanosine(46)-N7)-methyltransferase TrmB [Chitinophagaceae bacterium]